MTCFQNCLALHYFHEGVSKHRFNTRQDVMPSLGCSLAPRPVKAWAAHCAIAHIR